MKAGGLSLGRRPTNNAKGQGQRLGDKETVTSHLGIFFPLKCASVVVLWALKAIQTTHCMYFLERFISFLKNEVFL